MVKFFVTNGAFSSTIRNRLVNLGHEISWNITDSNAIIFTGGEDISPSIYGDENISSFPNERRDKLEIKFYEIATKRKMKIMGICRGHQLLLALNGAKLVQDLYHHSPHQIISKVSFIPTIVNSLHHQGVHLNQLPKGFKLLGYEPKTSIIEATISPKKKIITVQFHPEIMNEKIFEKIIQELEEL